MSETASAVTAKDEDHLAPGDVVSGLEASELVEIHRVIPFGGKTLVEGVGLQSRRMVQRPLTADVLASLVKACGWERTFDGAANFSVSAPKARAADAAEREPKLFDGRL